jgi:hypothetical protein
MKFKKIAIISTMFIAVFGIFASLTIDFMEFASNNSLSELDKVNVKVDFNEKQPQIKKITVSNLDENFKYKVEESQLIQENGKSVFIISDEKETILYIYKDDGISIVGQGTIDVTNIGETTVAYK